MFGYLKKKWDRFRNWFIFGVLGIGVAIVATGGVIEVFGECFVEAEINDPIKGLVLGATKGEGDCIELDSYIISKWQAGEMPNIDIAKISKEETLVATNKIANDYGITHGEENIYLALKNQTNLVFAGAKDVRLNIRTYEEYTKK